MPILGLFRSYRSLSQNRSYRSSPLRHSPLARPVPPPLALSRFCSAPQRALAKNGALRHSQLPVSATGSGRCSCPHRGRQEHARGCRLGGGKAHFSAALPYHSFAGFDGGTLGSPFGGAGERSETERGAQRLRLTTRLPGLTAVHLAPPSGELARRPQGGETERGATPVSASGTRGGSSRKSGGTAGKSCWGCRSRSRRRSGRCCRPGGPAGRRRPA